MNAVERQDVEREIEQYQGGAYAAWTSDANLESRETALEIIEQHMAALREKLLPEAVRTLRELQRRKVAVEAQIPVIRQAIKEESDRWNSYAPYPDESICANYTLNGLYSDLRFKLSAIEKYADEIEDVQEVLIEEELVGLEVAS
jgi:hypothetical protein